MTAVAFAVEPYKRYASTGVNARNIYPGQHFACCCVTQPASSPAKQPTGPTTASLKLDSFVVILVAFVTAKLSFIDPAYNVVPVGPSPRPSLQPQVERHSGEYQ